MNSGSSRTPPAGRSRPTGLSVDTAASTSVAAFRNRAVPAMPASASGGSSSGAARTLSARASHAAHALQLDDVDSFPLPPEMLKTWSDLEGVEGTEPPPYVTLDAPEAELLGYPTPTEPPSAASAGQAPYQFDLDDIDAQALTSLQAADGPAAPPALVTSFSTAHDDAPPLPTPPSDLEPSCHSALPAPIPKDVPGTPPAHVASPATPQSQGWRSVDPHAIDGTCLSPAPAEALTPSSASAMLQSQGEAPSPIATPPRIDGDQPEGEPNIQLAAVAVELVDQAPALLPLEYSAVETGDARPASDAVIHARPPGVLSPRFRRVAEPLGILTPTPSRVMNTRTFPAVSQSPSPAPIQWSQDAGRSSSAPPQVGSADVGSVTEHAAVAAFGTPTRPRSCGADLPIQPLSTAVDRITPRDGRENESPATSPPPPALVSGGSRVKDAVFTGEPLKQLSTVETPSVHPVLEISDGGMERAPGGVDGGSTPGKSSSGNPSLQPNSPRRSPSKWWQAGPSPYRHRPLTLVNATLPSSVPPMTSELEPSSGERRASSMPVVDDEELSELETGSEAEASVASTPYLSTVSTPADSSASVHEAPSPSKSAPTHKPKGKGNARQLLDLQTYSTSILGGQAMMSAKRTRHRDSIDIPTPGASPPQASTPRSPKRQKTAPQIEDLAEGGDVDQPKTSTGGRKKKAPAAKRKKEDPGGGGRPEVAQKRPRQKGTSSAGPPSSDLPLEDAATTAKDRTPAAPTQTRSSSSSRSPWTPAETAILKDFFGNGVFNGDKSVQCRGVLTKAGFSRTAGAILTRAREQYKKGVFKD